MRRRNVCACCGRADFATFRDNHGREYVGCKHCRLLTVEEIERVLRATTRAEKRDLTMKGGE